jgi:hypothetical protein
MRTRHYSSSSTSHPALHACPGAPCLALIPQIQTFFDPSIDGWGFKRKTLSGLPEVHPHPSQCPIILKLIAVA